MATHSSVLAWRIPGTGEPGGLPSMGSHRVRSDLAAAAAGDFLNQRSQAILCGRLTSFRIKVRQPSSLWVSSIFSHCLETDVPKSTLSPEAKIDTQVYLCIASGRQWKTFKHSKGKTKCVCVCVCVCMQKKALVPQLCPTLCDPKNYNLCPWNSLGKNPVVGRHFLLHGIFQPRNQTQVSCIVGRCFTVWATSKLTFMYDGGGSVAKSCPTLVTPWTVAHHTPLSMGFPSQEYWSGLPFPAPGDLFHQGSNPCLLYWMWSLYHWTINIYFYILSI